MPDDPVLRSARREALWTLALWLAAATYTVTYCLHYGYDRAPETLDYVLWFPDWVFWGIVVPWIVCAIVSSCFALFVMEDDPLTSDIDSPTEDDSLAEETGGG